MLFLFQFDYDSDGMNELVLVTADGVVSFVKNDGSFLEGETFKVLKVAFFGQFYSQNLKFCLFKESQHALLGYQLNILVIVMCHIFLVS